MQSVCKTAKPQEYKSDQHVITARDDADICRDLVSKFESDQVSHANLVNGHGLLFALTNDSDRLGQKCQKSSHDGSRA